MMVTEEELAEALQGPLTLEAKTDILGHYIEKIAGILEQIPILAQQFNVIAGRVELIEQTVFGPGKDEEGELVDV